MAGAECTRVRAWVRAVSAAVGRGALRADPPADSRDGHFQGDPLPGVVFQDVRTALPVTSLPTGRAEFATAALDFAIASAAGADSTDIPGDIRGFTIPIGGGIQDLRTTKIKRARWTRRIK